MAPRSLTTAEDALRPPTVEDASSITLLPRSTESLASLTVIGYSTFCSSGLSSASSRPTYRLT